jgi:hypothetical protein
MRRVMIGSLTAAVVLAGAFVSAASASTPVSLSPQYFLYGSNTLWDVSSTASSSGAGTPNACLASPDTFAGAVDAATQSPSSLDAFDGGLMLLVGGAGFTDADNTGAYNGSDTLTAGPTKMSGLSVGVKETALSTSQTLRMLVSFKNGSRKNRATNVVLDTALGGGPSGEAVIASSSGDTSFTPADRWVITNNTTGTDATPTLVFYGKGSVDSKVIAVTKQPSVDACATVKMRVKIPAKSTRYLLFFAQVHAHGTNPTTKSDARVFNAVTGSSPLMAAVGPKVRRKIVNWKI